MQITAAHRPTGQPYVRRAERSARMRRRTGLAGLLALICFGLCAGPARAELRADPSPSIPATRELGRDPYRFASGDTVDVVARRGISSGRPSALSRYQYALRPDSRYRRPVPVSLLLRPKTIELSRFACAIYGADLGAGTASALGGVGLVSGLWGEKTTGYLMGAGAILGALWGGTAGASEDRFRIRIGVDPADPGAGQRPLGPDGRD